MKLRTLCVAAAIGAIGGAAQAQALYSGDCERARAMDRETSVGQRISGPYVGVGDSTSVDECGRRSVWLFRMTPGKAAARSVVYNVTAKMYRLDKTSGACPDPDFWLDDVYGTITFSTAVVQRDGYCDLVVNADMDLKQRSNAGFNGGGRLNVFFFDKDRFGISQDDFQMGVLFHR